MFQKDGRVPLGPHEDAAAGSKPPGGDAEGARRAFSRVLGSEREPTMAACTEARSKRVNPTNATTRNVTIESIISATTRTAPFCVLFFPFIISPFIVECE